VTSVKHTSVHLDELLLAYGRLPCVFFPYRSFFSHRFYIGFCNSNLDSVARFFYEAQYRPTSLIDILIITPNKNYDNNNSLVFCIPTTALGNDTQFYFLVHLFMSKSCRLGLGLYLCQNLG